MLERGDRSGRLLDAVCVLLSAHFAIAYNTLTNPMVAFGTYKNLDRSDGPFAYRMLPALLWKLCAWVLGPLTVRFPWLRLPNLNKPFDSNDGWYMVLLTFFAVWGTLAVARRLLREIDRTWGFEWLALGLVYAAYFDTILVLNRNLFYPYDLLALFFFTLLVYLAYRGRPVSFTAALAVAMLNKETAIMAILLYFGLQVRRRDWKATAAICGGMGAVAISVRLMEVVYLHRVCPGCHMMAENQLTENLHQIANPLFWLSETAVFGFAWVAAAIFWRYVPYRLRITSLTMYGVWVAGMTVVGVLREVRIFSELSPVLLLVVATGIHQRLESRAAA